MTERSAAEWVQEGLAYHQQGDLGEAQERYQRALETDSASADALHFLGMARFQAGEPEAAEDLIRQSMEMRPGSATYRYNWGQFLENQGRREEAVWAYELALTLDPRMASALNERGRLLLQANRLSEAETAFRGAISVSPEFAQAYTNLGLVLWEQGDLPGALELFRQACANGPDLLPAYLSQISLLIEMDRVKEALEVADQAQAVGLQHPRLEAQRAQAEQILGRLEGAASRLEGVLADHPDDFQALNQLAPLAGKLGRPFPREQAEVLLQSPETQSEDRSLLAFALGAYADSQGDYDAAFMYWLEGNQVEGQRLFADELEGRIGYWRLLRQAFSPAVVEALGDWGDPDPEPIFVVGTPRSGTTLVEQILASHPRVSGVGESGLINHVLQDHLQDSDLKMAGEQGGGLSLERSAELARIYWNKLRELAPGAERIVDKTPGNLHHLGLIWTLFPNARVVLTRRDLLDAGVSMFSLRFAQSMNFAFDMETLGRFLREAQFQMAHWQDVLPEDFLLQMDYEALITEPERKLEQLLAHCGLEWDPACLRFFETERAVRTASQAQVRQPLYQSSMHRWSRYQDHLLPLAHAAGMTERLPEDARTAFQSFSRLGERQLARGQIQEAIHSFRRALIWEPSRREYLHARWGKALEHAECYREAAVCFRTALEAGVLDEDPAARTEAEVARIRCLRKTRAWPEVERLLAGLSSREEPLFWCEEGRLLLHKGETEEAKSRFRAALGRTDAEEAWQGWAEALEWQGRGTELQAALEDFVAEQPERELPARMVARFHRQNGDLEVATEWARRASELSPQCHQCHTLLAHLQFLRDRPEVAEQMVQKALALCPDHAPAHLLMARIHLVRSEFGLASKSAWEVLGRYEDPEASVLLGRAEVLNGGEEKGLARIREARRAHPEVPRFWEEEIVRLFELGEHDRTREVLAEARQRFPESGPLRFQELRLMRREGAGPEVLEGLKSLPQALQETPAYQAELGHLHDRNGEPDRAIACFREANRRIAQTAAVQRYPKEVVLSRIARLRASVTEEWVRHWRAPSRASGWDQPPVFLIGFPRSGTTLLDQVLSSHSQVEVLEEKPVFNDVFEALRARHGGDLKGLAEMEGEEIAELQGVYRQALGQYREDLRAPLVVDKMPLNTIEAAMMYRLFPDARFLFARRHPADCVLSAFMQLFAPNVAMANFHSLEDGARFYRAVMALWEQYRQLFPGMQVHEVRYEELVEDFDTVVGGALAFLGLDWEEGVRNYRETAMRRGRITTPSRSQVTQPLYRHARYRWRRYRTHFGQAWEDLIPFIRAAGYPET